MRAIRIYQPGQYTIGDTLELSHEAGQHVGVVLRMQPAEQLILFCGDNREFTANITAVHKKRVEVTIIQVNHVNRESPRAIHLAQAMSKGDRMEMVVQKSVELGVASITPLFTDRCVIKLDEERLEKKRMQWEGIAIAACEQSGRNQLPIIHRPISLIDYLKTDRPELNIVLNPKIAKNWRDIEFGSSEIGLVIGPEGGLSKDEMELLLAHNFSSLYLGPRVLRTETAALVALSLLQAVCGDL